MRRVFTLGLLVFISSLVFAQKELYRISFRSDQNHEEYYDTLVPLSYLKTGWPKHKDIPMFEFYQTLNYPSVETAFVKPYFEELSATHFPSFDHVFGVDALDASSTLIWPCCFISHFLFTSDSMVDVVIPTLNATYCIYDKDDYFIDLYDAHHSYVAIISANRGVFHYYIVLAIGKDGRVLEHFAVSVI